MNLKQIVALFTLIVIGGVSLAPALTGPAYAGASRDPKDPSFQVLPECDPAIFPKDTTKKTAKGGPCGFTEFEQLIVNIIRWLIYIMAFIAFVLIGWAGFKILTSAGNSEALSQAKSMIKIVAIGILIAALSYIIIVNLFNVLNVQGVKYGPAA